MTRHREFTLLPHSGKKGKQEMETKAAAEVILHVGLPKTGTTAIQRYMYHRREAYADLGIHWAETHPNGIHEINDWAHHVYSHKWGGWLDVSKFVITPDSAWAAFGDTVRAKAGRHILSSERFADLLPLPIGMDMLRFIAETIAPAQLKIIGYVRRQDNLIESHIKELIKGGNLKGTIDEYLENLPSFVFFDQSFLNAVEVLGKENVTVRLYERDFLVRQDIVLDFLEACTLPVLDNPKGEVMRANPSLNTLSSKVLSDPRIVKAFQNKRFRHKFISDMLNEERFSHCNRYALLDDETQRQIMSRFNEGNKRLAEMFFDDYTAKALERDGDYARPTLKNSELVLTYDDLVELLIVLRPPVP